MELTLKKPVRNIVAITGLPRSGKSMLAPIVSSLKRAETLKMNHTLEQFPVLNHLGLMSDNVTKYIMRYMVATIIYDSMIGRNSNFRFSDWTSIWNSEDPRKYIKRLYAEEGDTVFEKIEQEKRINVFMTHNTVWHAKIYFKVFPDLKIIHIDRHPVDSIYSWFSRGYDSSFLAKDRNQLLLINHNNSDIPYYANGWEDEYKNLSAIDRIIKMVYFIKQNHIKSLENLPENNQNQIILINFDKIVTNPQNDIVRICSFLNTTQTLYTLKVMERENCPRNIDNTSRNKKLNEIKINATEEYFMHLQEMIDDYESQQFE